MICYLKIASDESSQKRIRLDGNFSSGDCVAEFHNRSISIGANMRLKAAAKSYFSLLPATNVKPRSNTLPALDAGCYIPVGRYKNLQIRFLQRSRRKSNF